MCIANLKKFWKSYPHPVDREAAFYVFRELNPDDTLFEKIITGLHGQIESYKIQVMLGSWVPKWKYPANWLAKKCWQTDPYVFEHIVYDMEN
ncbi:hypothetical protein SC125_15110 [Legionella pneumophila serogroup 1]